MNSLSFRRAIERLGAKQDDRLRDTVVFSIVRAEWAAVKKHLELELGAIS